MITKIYRGIEHQMKRKINIRKDISEIKTFFLLIKKNENFYFDSLEKAGKAILEHCKNKGIPTPNEIQYIMDGYYIKWNFERGFSEKEIFSWEFVQNFLHGVFEEFGSDSSIYKNTEVMLPEADYDYIKFEKKLYSSPIEFLSLLPLNCQEIKEYRKLKKITKKKQNKLAEISTEPGIMERAFDFSDTFTWPLKDENCEGEQYRYYQRKTKGSRKKFYKWLNINQSEILPNFDAEAGCWLSAATYYCKFRRKGNVAAINCNFVVLNWEKSELDFIPTPEEGKELVLSRCRELGLPAPKIISVPNGLEIKWLWEDRMTKILYENDFFNSKFNDNWDLMQKKLYEKFWTLGANSRKICATTMFSIPGSKDARKNSKPPVKIIREIHKGETVKSYRDIQKVLGLNEIVENENQDELLEQKWQELSENNPELVKDWLADVLKIHPSSKNWICFCFIKDKIWNNRWIRAFELRKFLINIIKKTEFNACDFYFSQGEFFNRYDRRVQNLVSINLCFVDLDYKILVKYRPENSENPSPEEWEEMIINHCRKLNIPLPNDVVFSGGGVHLKWIFDEPVTRPELALWRYCQQLLLVQFKTLGADFNSSDGARVLRLVGTYNHKDSLIIKDRSVRVLDRDFFAQNTLKKLNKNSLLGLVEALEKSQPENLEEWRQSLMKKPNLISPKPEEKAELKEQALIENKEAIEGIPCNYLILSRCPGETFEEQKINIFKRCHEYRNAGFDEPNQIIKFGNTLLIKWTYQSVLTWRALSKWQAVQKLLCRYFEDWGALDNPEYLKATALLPVPGFEYDGQTARLEYNDLEKQYTFNQLAKAVLIFSQKEVQEYRQKMKKRMKKKLEEAKLNTKHKKTKKSSNFAKMAKMRYMDIIKLLKLRRDKNGEIQQDTRELCCFWALVFAKQAGIITTYEEFTAKAKELIELCGLQFSKECTVSTLKSSFTKRYFVKTNKLILSLNITPEYQEYMSVLTRKNEKN